MAKKVPKIPKNKYIFKKYELIKITDKYDCLDYGKIGILTENTHHFFEGEYEYKVLFLNGECGWFLKENFEVLK